MGIISFRLVNVPKGTINIDESNLSILGESTSETQYISLLNQEGATNPTQTVLKNDTNQNFPIIRNSVGNYKMTLSESVTNELDKFNIIIGNSTGANDVFYESRLDYNGLDMENYIEIYARSKAEGAFVDVLENTPIFITKLQ